MATAVEAIQINGYKSLPKGGLGFMIAAFMANYRAVQEYSTTLMALSASVQERQAKEGAASIKEMQDGPIATMKTVSDRGDSTATNTINEANADLNVKNNKYSQRMTELTGIVNGLNQSSSDTNQTLQTNLQMVGNNGVLSILQTLARILG